MKQIKSQRIYPQYCAHAWGTDDSSNAARTTPVVKCSVSNFPEISISGPHTAVRRSLGVIVLVSLLFVSSVACSFLLPSVRSFFCSSHRSTWDCLETLPYPPHCKCKTILQSGSLEVCSCRPISRQSKVACNFNCNSQSNSRFFVILFVKFE